MHTSARLYSRSWRFAVDDHHPTVGSSPPGAHYCAAGTGRVPALYIQGRRSECCRRPSVLAHRYQVQGPRFRLSIIKPRLRTQGCMNVAHKRCRTPDFHPAASSVSVELTSSTRNHPAYCSWNEVCSFVLAKCEDRFFKPCWYARRM